ncbi:MAG TPA: PxKF domain-containing protein, partial [Actinomycetota bacterium]|nr:PxKF domain-containing protein [Actinomycetota bacterium]
VSGLTITGADFGNYSLSQPTTSASILAWNAQGSGFYQPVGVPNSVFVAAPGTPPASTSSTIWNVAKGGSTIPLKFNVFAGTVEKTSTSDISAFTAVKLSACSAGASMEDVEFVTTGSTTLRYDLTDGQFVQNWQTPRVNGEACYRATVTFADGSSLSAFFRLRK